jgi:hypothetical protein
VTDVKSLVLFTGTNTWSINDLYSISLSITTYELHFKFDRRQLRVNKKSSSRFDVILTLERYVPSSSDRRNVPCASEAEYSKDRERLQVYLPKRVDQIVVEIYYQTVLIQTSGVLHFLHQ